MAVVAFVIVKPGGDDNDKPVGGAPGKPARLNFVAKLEGAFEMESHESEAKIAGRQVEPG